MSNLIFASPVVEAWCDRYKVCSEGRALAAPCIDLATVWYKIDRPGWLLWFLGMEVIENPEFFLNRPLLWIMVSLPDSLTMDLYNCEHLPLSGGVLPDDWADYSKVDPLACDIMRRLVPCPFKMQARVIEAIENDDGTITPCTAATAPETAAKPIADAKPKQIQVQIDQAPNGNVRTALIDGRQFVPADEAVDALNQQKRVIHALNQEAKHTHRWFVWSIAAISIALLAVWGLVTLIKWEDEQC